MDRNSRFLRKEYTKNLFPLMFSVLGGTINSLIDCAFVSQRLGNDGLVAINMCMPVYLILCSIGSLIANGASIMSSQEIGSERMKEAEKYYQTGFLFMLITGSILTLTGVVFCRPISNLLAQNGSFSGYVYRYCLITIIGTIPTIILYLPTYYLQLEGKMEAISFMMIVIIFTDILFDYLLMFTINLGIVGAALASLISTTLACTYGFVRLRSGYSNYHFQFIIPEFNKIKSMLIAGSPAALGNFIDAIKFLMLNAIILHSGGPSIVSVWAVLNSLSEFALSITSGVPQAAAPMICNYYTSRENSGIRILTKLQIQSGLFFSSVFAVVLLILHSPIESLFILDNSLIIPILCLGLFCIFDVICSIWITFFQSTIQITLSNFLIFCRKLLFPIGTVLVLSLCNGYLFLFLPLGSLFTLFTGLLLTKIASIKKSSEDHALSRYLLLDDYLEKTHKVIDFSIIPNPENICYASEQIKDFCEINQMKSKLIIRLGLAIEELLSVISEKNSSNDSVDMRAYTLEGTTGIRIRYAGKQYNPFESTNEDDDLLMGVNMINNLSEVVTYNYSLGMNTINILFETCPQSMQKTGGNTTNEKK